jgi:hypothetical protein
MHIDYNMRFTHYWCHIYEILDANIPQVCVAPTTDYDVLEFIVGLIFFAFLLICIECILQANE